MTSGAYQSFWEDARRYRPDRPPAAEFGTWQRAHGTRTGCIGLFELVETIVTEPNEKPPVATSALTQKVSGMPYGRSRLYDHSHVVEPGDVVARAVSKRGTAGATLEIRREIDTLRSMNAHLLRQIAVLKQREAHAQRLADRDGLTGLYNRRRMLELLNAAIDDAARLDQRVGFLFVDLDGFKAVNDAQGHAAGDELLITVASRIAARARTADFVCRYGGDEFAVILPRVANLTAVGRVADSIRSRVALPYRIDGVELKVTAAIGVSIYPDQARNAAELVNRADEGMYRAKALAADSNDTTDVAAAPTRRRDDQHKRRCV